MMNEAKRLRDCILINTGVKLSKEQVSRVLEDLKDEFGFVLRYAPEESRFNKEVNIDRV